MNVKPALHTNHSTIITSDKIHTQQVVGKMGTDLFYSKTILSNCPLYF